MQAYGAAQATDADKSLRNVLSADQMVRLKQLILQRRQANAFLQPVIQHSLRLTEEQVTKVKQIVERAIAQTQELEFRIVQGTNPEERRKIRASIARGNAEEAMRSCMALLTEEQKKDWRALTGKPFAFEPRPMAP